MAPLELGALLRSSRSFAVSRARPLAVLSALGLVALAALTGCGSQAGTGHPGPRGDAPSAAPAPDVSALLKRMSVEDKVGQLFVPTVPGAEPAAGAALI